LVENKETSYRLISELKYHSNNDFSN
jgi:hypothetical protein